MTSVGERRNQPLGTVNYVFIVIGRLDHCEKTNFGEAPKVLGRAKRRINLLNNNKQYSHTDIRRLRPFLQYRYQLFSKFIITCYSVFNHYDRMKKEECDRHSIFETITFIVTISQIKLNIPF